MDTTSTTIPLGYSLLVFLGVIAVLVGLIGTIHTANKRTIEDPQTGKLVAFVTTGIVGLVAMVGGIVLSTKSKRVLDLPVRSVRDLWNIPVADSCNKLTVRTDITNALGLCHLDEARRLIEECNMGSDQDIQEAEFLATVKCKDAFQPKPPVEEEVFLEPGEQASPQPPPVDLQHIVAVNKLLDTAVDQKVIDEALYNSCVKGDAKVARILIERGGANVKCASDPSFGVNCEYQCLIEAITRGHLEMVKLLIEKDKGWRDVTIRVPFSDPAYVSPFLERAERIAARRGGVFGEIYNALKEDYEALKQETQ